MSGTRSYMFVLWADRFDKSAATVFVTEFRIAGLRTKLVSLVSHASAGAYGLALAPDLTLDQALPLAGRAACVVIPGGAAAIRRLGDDRGCGSFGASAGPGRFSSSEQTAKGRWEVSWGEDYRL